jgi:hypothetical protein
MPAAAAVAAARPVSTTDGRPSVPRTISMSRNFSCVVDVGPFIGRCRIRLPFAQYGHAGSSFVIRLRREPDPTVVPWLDRQRPARLLKDRYWAGHSTRIL